ncbi:MAG TPA: hypothetical protein VJX23_12350 [Candidatus Binataceae bacterium]|nr:hypothetical protein [Candidatus Binataceae bacterium]
MMTLRTFFLRAAVALLALFAVACSAMKSGSLSTGMTPDQAVQAMGQPDLKDSIADPNHSGASVLRYVWLEPGKAAIFSSDDRLASIQDVETNTKQHIEQQTHAEAAGPQQFDPIETPLNYLFFPARAAAIYFGAGVNCVGGGGCQKPELPPPGSAG